MKQLEAHTRRVNGDIKAYSFLEERPFDRLAAGAPDMARVTERSFGVLREGRAAVIKT